MLAKVLNALRAFPILASTSSSVHPVILITLPKYVKDVTSSMPRLLIMICSIALLLILIVLVCHIINFLFTEISLFVWENIDLGRVYRPHCICSLPLTSVKILPNRLTKLG